MYENDDSKGNHVVIVTVVIVLIIDTELVISNTV